MAADEIEAKFRVDDPEAFRVRLDERGLTAGETVFEVNRLFDDADGSLRQSGAALRLREEFRETDGTVVRTLLTYKGPRVESRMKRRPEAELAVESAAPLVEIFGAIGLSETFRYEKRRTPFHGGACEVVLDEVPHLGHFAEIEGPSEEAVFEELEGLGLSDVPLIRTSYVHLLSEHLAAAGLDPRRAVFEGGE
ncbi:MAG: class IV adenylate cyclase [Phycisphaerae bacterium]